jgi:hypothetical protein
MSSDGVKQAATTNEYGGWIYESTDSGATWTPSISYPAGWFDIAMSSDGVKQAAVVTGGQIYVSTDSGATWTPVESSRSWRSIAMSSNGVKQAAVVNGGQIYESTNSGSTWTPVESSRNWRSIAMSSNGVKQTAVAYNGQIYESTNSGSTWTPVESSRSWTSIAISSDGVKQAAAAYNGQIYENYEEIPTTTTPAPTTTTTTPAPVVRLSYFNVASAPNNTSVTSTIDSSALITRIQSVYPGDTYFDTTSEMGPVYVYYTHFAGRQQKRLVHDLINHQAPVQWSSYAQDGTWEKTKIKAFDKDGAFVYLNRPDIGTGEDLTHSDGTIYLNT